MLYFVATPIGNLKDITLRALETLKDVDIIACEDTRKTQILLNHYMIKKRLIMYHKNNEKVSANGIIGLLKSGKNVAVVSDAGMPVISDPGSALIAALQEHNLSYTIIPGANAGLSALVLSGLDAQKFTFVGFLPNKNKDKKLLLNSLKSYQTTLIFYVAPHDVEKVLDDCYSVFGARKACLVKEITKVFETRCDFTLGETPQIQIKGEFVLIIQGASASQNSLEQLSLEQQIEFYVQSGMDKKTALKAVAKSNKIKNIYTFLKK